MTRVTNFAVSMLLLVPMVVGAEPYSVKVKAGTLLDPDGAIIEVEDGLYLNDEAAQYTFDTMVAMDDNIKLLTSSLNEANERIKKASAFVPGLPTWATVVISAALSALTVVVGVFVAREATSGN